MVFRPKAAQGSCKATAGSLSSSFIVGCLAGGTKSHDTKSHGTFTSPPLMQRLGTLQDQITGWATGIYKAGCGKFEGSLREIGGSWPNIVACPSLIGEQRILPAGRHDQRAERLGKRDPGDSPRTKKRTSPPTMAIGRCCPWHTS